jgi:hypothetical protein
MFHEFPEEILRELTVCVMWQTLCVWNVESFMVLYNKELNQEFSLKSSVV